MSKNVKTLVIAGLLILATSSSAFSASKPAKAVSTAVTEPLPAVSTPIAPVMQAPNLNYNIAIVDVQKVVASSSQVAALKKEQEAKTKSLIEFVEKARKEVAATTDTKKKEALEAKYNKELNAKKEAYDKAYAEKLKNIDDNITRQIENVAKSGGYSIILAKGVVLWGGNDITDTVIKAVK